MALFRIIQNVEGEENDDLVTLNKLIEVTKNDDERLPYYIKRVKILYDMKKWNEVLTDIDLLEKRQMMDNKLLSIKWKSTIYNEIAKVRSSMKDILGTTLFDNPDHVDLYINLNEENINQLINKNHTKKLADASKKRKKG